MNLAAISVDLRDTSDRYGGIARYLEAADALDRACSAFFKEQDLNTLRALNGAVAHCQRLRKEKVPVDDGGVLA